MHKSLITPPEIDSLAGQVLRQLQGQTYVNAMYALEVAQRQLANELTKLTDQQVFRPSSSQCSAPAGASILPGEVGALCTSPPPQPTTAAV